MSSLEQLKKNLTMIRDLKMTADEMKELSITPQAAATGLYCQQCRQCLSQCPHSHDIPAMMRSYMYAYGYKDLRQAWYTMAESGYTGRCNECDTCSVNCASGFDVKKKIVDIARLTDIPEEMIRV